MMVNLTAEEQYRIHGRFEPETAEELLNSLLRAEQFDDINHDDIKANFPEEDFLEPALEDLTDLKTRLEELRKSLRGKNRETVDEIISAVDDLDKRVTEIQDSTTHATEYALEQIKNIEKAIG